MIGPTNTAEATAAHEGSHVADREELVSVLTPAMSTDDWLNSKENITQYATEFRAYMVGAAVAQGRRESTYNADGYEYWNSGWKEAERDIRVRAGISTLLEKKYHVASDKPGPRIIEKKK